MDRLPFSGFGGALPLLFDLAALRGAHSAAAKTQQGSLRRMPQAALLFT